MAQPQDWTGKLVSASQFVRLCPAETPGATSGLKVEGRGQVEQFSLTQRRRDHALCSSRSGGNRSPTRACSARAIVILTRGGGTRLPREISVKSLPIGGDGTLLLPLPGRRGSE